MLNESRVLWKEGMFLEPHHFQTLERLRCGGINARIGSLVYGGYQYGFTELEIDRNALFGGNFSVVRASGVFPDGSSFNIGEGSAEGALSRPFDSYCSPDRLTLDVYLAIPAQRRYIEKTVSVPDETSPDNNKEIELGAPNYRIMFEGEPLDGCVRLLAARLSKNGNGYMELARGHAPPTLFTHGSEALRNCIGGLLELLWAKIGSLAGCRRQNELGLALFSPAEIHPFWLLNTLCTHTPLLGLLHRMPKIHPFEYYTQLTALCGSLLSFAPEISYESFPLYSHDDPAASLSALAERVRDALNVEFWTSTTALPLERVSPAVWSCRFSDERFLRSVNLFVGIAAKASQKELLLDVLQRMKVCSRDRLDLLVSSSMPGLLLIHVKNVPEGLAVKPDYLYFAVDRQGQYWQGVETSGTLGIHFPGNYQDMKLELLALRHQ